MKPWNVEICDVTLRDGEQTPGVSFSCEEKVDIARTLDTIGIEVIEAGFPAVSENEKQCVKTIAHLGLDARICGFSRAKKRISRLPSTATLIWSPSLSRRRISMSGSNSENPANRCLMMPSS